jgi:molecular chaperone GrpE|tara:strand:- start:17256 stop:17765 length:510 start_codon:yes stop_codon:yes gene_type:complete
MDKKEVKKPAEPKKTHEKDSSKKQIEELTDTLKRLQAEFENFKKRIDKEKVEFRKYVHADMTRHLLPIVDSFEIALKNTENREKFVDGVNLIYTQLYSMLESQGLRPIKAVGEKFDPYKHEVLIKEGSDKPDGTVLDEMQKGYMFKDRVLRFSKVKVSEHKKQDKKIDT